MDPRSHDSSSSSSSGSFPDLAPASAVRPAPGAARLHETNVLAKLIAARATNDGTTLALHPGLCFYRVTSLTTFKKRAVHGPRLIAIAQGRKVAKFQGGDLRYDEDHYLVVTGEAEFEGVVLEASPTRPYLALCMELSPELIARSLLALSDVAAGLPAVAPRQSSSVPGFVSPLDSPITSALVRFVSSLDDPLERKVVAPLALEELVFRLLRSEGAAILRGAIRDGDASIQSTMRFVRENVTLPHTVEAMARHVGMSPSHFAHRFTAVARVSPMRFVKHARLEAARELLLAGNVRVNEAATRVGYESASHFTRDFKSAYAMSPAEWLRKLAM